MASPDDSSSTIGGAQDVPAQTTTETHAPVQAAPATAPVSIFQNLAPLTLKLDRGNYSFWKSQVLPALRAHDLEGFILGTRVFKTVVILLVAVVEVEEAEEIVQFANFATVWVMWQESAIIGLT
ncbi:hypothetical protein F8388_020228 [Cannabis sativa]|uniref:Retrotransposon Copia-like N-terminal domain-containing protein n=1 Tax=Cannabis sativa TaxID=3483 RepID=A0A7J6FVP8_CANSA|nr:hypothetical protein F8388_020228 [Cannabis sativa]